MGKKLIIYGIGDFARQVKYMAENFANYHVIGFCADKKYIVDSKFVGLDVVDIDSVGERYSSEEVEIIAAIGYRSMRAREAMFQKIKKTGLKIASIIHKHAIVDPSATIGENAIIKEGAIIEFFSSIGNNCYLGGACLIAHDVQISDHCYVCAQTLMSGRVYVGARTFIGVGSTVLQDKKIGKDCLVGARSLVVRDIPDFSKCIGSPAKIVSTHEETGAMVI